MDMRLSACSCAAFRPGQASFLSFASPKESSQRKGDPVPPPRCGTRFRLRQSSPTSPGATCSALAKAVWRALLGVVVCLNLLFFFVKFCVLGLLLEKPLSLPFDATTN